MKYILLAAFAAAITIGNVKAESYEHQAYVALFKGECLRDSGKLKPADLGRWVCFLPNGSLRVST